LFSNEWLSDLFADPNVAKTAKLLAILLDAEVMGYSTEQMKEIASAHGASDVEKWNVYSFLSAVKRQGKVKQIGGKWSLTSAGRTWLAGQNILGGSVILQKREDIRKALLKVTNPHSQRYVEEAIRCIEAGALRASTIMAWIGAMSILYHHVFTNCLAAFDIKAANHPRIKGWNTATDVDDLATINEAFFLEVIETIGLVTPDQKKLLKNCLDWRNSSGHGNNVVIGEQQVAAHIEILVETVYSRFV
jgi:hypothetical protein